MWAISGLVVIPKDPQLKTAKTENGTYLNFKGVTQGWGGDGSYQHWNCSMWVPEKKLQEWKDSIQPGHVFYVEHGYATSYPVADGKYHGTNIKLDYNKTRHMAKPMWVKK